MIRLFARPPSSLTKPVKIRPKDFDRQMEWMSGISMFRAKAKDSAREKWSTEWPKGILIAKAGDIQSLNLVFYDTGNDHFSVRCRGCDLSQNQGPQRPLCSNDRFCEFDPASAMAAEVGETQPAGIRIRLAQIFTIETSPY